MNNAAVDTDIYHNGRTYAEHCAWIDAMSEDEKAILCTPVGHRYTLVYISLVKRLLAAELSPAYRIRFLEWLDRCGDSWLTPDKIATVAPMDDNGYEMLCEATKLGAKKALDTVATCDVFNAFVALNPTLLTAIKMISVERRPFM
jgi:hypothetical protein